MMLAAAPLLALPLAFAAGGGQGQAPKPPATPATPAAASTDEKVTVSFSDPARPGTVKVSLVTGGITVRGYDGRDVIVEARLKAGDDDDDDDRGGSAEHQGLRRIGNTASGLTVEEENNVMRIGSSMHNREIELVIQVPVRTSLNLSTVNDGNIVVERVEGEIEVNNVNGAVTLQDVAGTVVAHALNDDLRATLRQVSGRPMSFSTLNGDIDVSLPPDTRANVHLETSMGEIYSDFDIQLQPTAVNRTVEDNRARGGKYKLKVEKGMTGRINGGGPEITFKSFNGDIHIRQRK